MDNIVDELRAAARSGNLALGISFNCETIADEIERLWAEVDRLAKALGDSNPLHPVYQDWEARHKYIVK